MVNHPNRRKSAPLRFTERERVTLIAILDQVLERLAAMKRDSKLIRKIRQKVIDSDPGE